MDRLLRARTALPLLALLALGSFAAPVWLNGLLLSMSMIPVVIAAAQAAARYARDRACLLAAASGFSAIVLFGLDVAWSNGPPSLAGMALMIVTAVLLFAAWVLLSYARRPQETREGIVDSFAALAAIVVLQSQWLALEPGASLHTVLAPVGPLIALFLLGTLAAITWGIAKDARQDKRLLGAMLATGSIMCTGTFVTRGFSAPDLLPWGVSCYLAAGWLMTRVYRAPAYALLSDPEPPRRRYLSIRWFGPVCAVATTPLMIGIFIVRGAVPTPAVGIACTALTGLALWRGLRLVRDRERARRELVAEQRFRDLVEHAADVILLADDDLRITAANGGVLELLGFAHDQLEGVPIEDLFDGESVAQLRGAMATLSRHGASAALERDICLPARQGTQRWVSVRVTNHLLTPTIGGWVFNVHDVTGRKRAEQALEMLAHYDGLTGLLNRTALRHRLEEALTTGAGSTALLFCDLDGFKAVNDTLGHESGDELLRHVAGRWSALLRAGDALGRWGGDEFLLICAGIDSVEKAHQVAQRLVEVTGESFQLRAGVGSVGVSVGVVVHTPGESADAFIARADREMYAVKRAGQR